MMNWILSNIRSTVITHVVPNRLDKHKITSRAHVYNVVRSLRPFNFTGAYRTAISFTPSKSQTLVFTMRLLVPSLLAALFGRTALSFGSAV